MHTCMFHTCPKQYLNMSANNTHTHTCTHAHMHTCTHTCFTHAGIGAPHHDIIRSLKLRTLIWRNLPIPPAPFLFQPLSPLALPVLLAFWCLFLRILLT